VEADDVLEVLIRLEDNGLTAWIDGGWGIDALIREIGRPHSDLDLVVRSDELDRVREVLALAGFHRILRDWLPTALALADDRGRELDLHPVNPTPDGGGNQPLPDGTSFHYPAPVRGAITGRKVWCVDAETQVRAHTGYELTEKDHRDLDRLRDQFGGLLS
jgi:lincosamide nucleotidyltransferase A/C/D/E